MPRTRVLGSEEMPRGYQLSCVSHLVEFQNFLSCQGIFQREFFFFFFFRLSLNFIYLFFSFYPYVCGVYVTFALSLWFFSSFGFFVFDDVFVKKKNTKVLTDIKWRFSYLEYINSFFVY